MGQGARHHRPGADTQSAPGNRQRQPLDLHPRRRQSALREAKQPAGRADREVTRRGRGGVQHECQRRGRQRPADQRPAGAKRDKDQRQPVSVCAYPIAGRRGENLVGSVPRNYRHEPVQENVRAAWLVLPSGRQRTATAAHRDLRDHVPPDRGAGVRPERPAGARPLGGCARVHRTAQFQPRDGHAGQLADQRRHRLRLPGGDDGRERRFPDRGEGSQALGRHQGVSPGRHRGAGSVRGRAQQQRRTRERGKRRRQRRGHRPLLGPIPLAHRGGLNRRRAEVDRHRPDAVPISRDVA